MSSRRFSPIALAGVVGLFGLGIWLILSPDGTAREAASTNPAASASGHLRHGVSPSAPSEPGVSDSCAACEAKACVNERGGCSALSGNAEDGPSKGLQSRASLCEQVLACVRKTGCAPGARGVGYECYCGNDDVQKCITQATANGPCRDVIEAAAESTSPMTVGQRWGKQEFALGAAFRRVRCAADHCRAECFPGSQPEAK